MNKRPNEYDTSPRYPLQLPKELHIAIKVAAAKEGISMRQWVTRELKKAIDWRADMPEGRDER